MLAVPVPDTAIQLPWKPEVAWVASTCMMEGELVPDAPRNVLAAQTARAKELGLTVKTGVECEFFLLTPDGSDISDPADIAAKPCYDQQALMRPLTKATFRIESYDEVVETISASIRLPR